MPVRVASVEFKEQMTELHFTLDFIRGMSFGLEFPDTSDEEDLKLAVVIDLAILRLVFLFWNTNE